MSVKERYLLKITVFVNLLKIQRNSTLFITWYVGIPVIKNYKHRNVVLVFNLSL